MTRLLRLEVRNFRGWRDASIALDRPLVLVVGENRRGKSSTLNAIEWCLFGKEVEKKGSGIPERIDWEVAHRGAVDGAVEVTLTFDAGAGPVRIARCREGAGARAEDRLEVSTSTGEKLEGQAAEAWMREARLPDWETWRCACCQHQEVLRGRLTDTADRSLILTSLLGLEEHDRMHRVLRDQQPGKMVGRLDEELAELEKVVLFRLSAPAEDLFDSERRLETLGLERAALRRPRAGDRPRRDRAGAGARRAARHRRRAARLRDRSRRAGRPEMGRGLGCARAERVPDLRAPLQRDETSREAIGPRSSSSSPPTSAGGRRRSVSTRKRASAATRRRRSACSRRPGPRSTRPRSASSRRTRRWRSSVIRSRW